MDFKHSKIGSDQRTDRLLLTFSRLVLRIGYLFKLVIVNRPVFSLGVSQSQHNMHKKQTCENLSSVGRRSCEIIIKGKKILDCLIVERVQAALYPR